MPMQSVQGFKGYTSAFSILQTPLEYLRYSKNVIADKRALRKRKAFKVLATPGKGRVSGAIEYLFGAGPRGILFKQMDSPYKWWTAGGSSLTTVTDRGASFGSPDASPQFVEYNNCIYAFDGTTRPMKLCTVSGALTWTRQGLTIDLVQLGGTWTNSLFNLSGPNLATASWTTGVYYYALTLVITTDQGTIETNADVGILGSGSGLTVTVGVTNTPKMTMNAMITVPPGLTAVRLYRMSTAIGQTNYYFIKEVATTDGSFTFSDDTGAGNPNSQDLTRPIPTRNTQLTVAINAAVAHKTRIYGGFANQLYFTEAGYPEYWPATNTLVVGDPYDYIYRLISLPSGLVILKQRSVWFLQGNSFADFKLDQIWNQGNVSLRAGERVGNSFYFVNMGGLWKWDYGSSEPVRLSDLISEDFAALSDPEVLVYASMKFDRANNWLWISIYDTFYYVFDVVAQQFLGRFDVDSAATPTCFLEVNRFTNTPRMAAFNELGNLWSYDELASINGTNETTLDIEARTGMDWGRKGIQKVLDSFALFDRSVLTPTSSDEESVNVYLNDSAQATPKLIESFSLNDTSTKLKGLNQHAVRAAGITISGTALSFAKPWAITGFDLEYHEIGHIR